MGIALMSKAEFHLSSFISQPELRALVSRQIDALFVLNDGDAAVIDSVMPDVVEDCYTCFSRLRNKYFCADGRPVFSAYHSGNYTIFLYFLSRALSNRHRLLADKAYLLNKALNGVDLFHEVELPAVFFTDHPVGTVIGRASFSDKFMFSQNCTVGNNRGIYPRFGRNVYMLAGAKVIGNCTIGPNVVLAANACVVDQDVPPDTLVFGSSPTSN